MSMETEQYPIVGVAAPLGDVETLTTLLTHLPLNVGVGMVIIRQNEPTEDGQLAAALAPHTSMPVEVAADGAAVGRNRIYIAPAKHLVTFEDGLLRLKPAAEDLRRHSIDTFFTSLARGYGEAAIGVVLPGGDGDGASGLDAIKEHGGLTVICTTAEAAGPQDGSAVSTRMVDLELRIEDIGSQLLELAEHREQVPQGATAGNDHEQADAQRLYKSIYALLLQHVGHDFSGYKQKTFARRVYRRMQVSQVQSLEKYVELLNSNAEEVTALFRDLLIGVTNFFRDREAFQALQKIVIPKLFEGKRATDIVRIWSPGCATGEEVYSIAILLREFLDTLSSPPRVQIFATDIDEQALQVARNGRYPAVLVEHITNDRLKRFFTSDEVSFTVTKEIRDMCIFSSHNVIRDPPFSRIDLISCRNLLIYLGVKFQSQVIPVFHFSLRPRGFLFLGTSENVSQHADLFTPLDKRHRIFKRRDNAQVTMHFPLPNALRRLVTHESRRDGGEIPLSFKHSIEARILDRFSPAHVLINAEGDILHYSARTGKYLEPAAGLPNRHILAMARRGLRLDLNGALRQAVETRQAVTREHIAVELDDRVQLVNVTIEPFGDSDVDPLFMVVFADVGSPFDPSDSESRELVEHDRSHERLEQELRDTRERLQATIEEYETAVEELKSSNEELQSINEELQSTNEELETSKEELQSLNEELYTVNTELSAKVEEVDRANTDLQNLFESTQIATVFLDRGLVIRGYTPAVTSIFSLIQSDRGRPLSDIASHIELGNLWREIRSVLEGGPIVERNVHRIDGRAHYLMRILPYRGRHSIVEGALVTFIDISKAVAAEAQQRTLVEELNHRVRNMLTIVNALANQTLARSTSVDALRETLTGRIRAMGTAYGLVSRENWGDVSLQEILTRQLQPYAAGRVHTTGPRVLLKPNAALALGMVIHELATNAVKYGALSHAQGTIEITWTPTLGDTDLRIEWRENCQKDITAPTRKGFGTELIERELHHVLEARTEFSFTSKGLEINISIPVRSDRLRIQAQGETV